MKTEKEIKEQIQKAKELIELSELDFDYSNGVIKALEWMLGGKEPITQSMIKRYEDEEEDYYDADDGDFDALI